MRRKTIIGIATIILFALGLASAAMAACEPARAPAPMRFLVAENGAERWIAAEGLITDRTADEFQIFLGGLEDGPSTVILNSTGGRLAAGLALGRAIRDAGLATRVGDTRDCEGGARLGRGLCASSCAYAFLGGVTRAVGAEGNVGFHGIFPAGGQPAINPETLRIATEEAQATLRDYVAEMGANPVLPDLVSLVGPDQLYMPEAAARAILGIETEATRIALVTREQSQL